MSGPVQMFFSKRILRRLIAPYLVIPGVAIIVGLMAWLYVVNVNETSLREESGRSLQTTERLVETYEAQALRVLNQVNQSLRIVAYARRFGSQENSLAALQAQGLLLPNIIFTTRIIDRRGAVVESSRAMKFNADVVRKMLQQHANGKQVFVSEPYPGDAQNAGLIDVSRSVDGSPKGEVVVITFPVSYLVSDYDVARFGSSGVLALIGTEDGVIRAKRTGDEISFGEKIANEKLLVAKSEEQGHASLQDSPWDGIPRYTGVRSLYGFPLAVLVALSESERLQDVRASNRTRLLHTGIITTIALGVALSFGWLTWRIERLRVHERRARVEHAKQVEFMAYHDSLTSLPNRASFNRSLAEQMSQASDVAFAIMLLDLDGFKKVNDVQGHHTGDLLLKEVAKRLRENVREVDVVARLGGDEFVLLLPVMQRQEEISLVAERLVTTIGEPYSLDGMAAAVTASIGVAMFPADGTDQAQLTQAADRAMYVAKKRGKNAVVYANDSCESA